MSAPFLSTHPGGPTDVASPISVVIPAHNEAQSLGRNLIALYRDAPPLDVVVVCNGCTDGTEEVARAAAPDVRVLNIPEPSKSRAVQSGNQASALFPRVHLDADVELSGSSLAELVAPLKDGRALATAARRVLPTDDCSLWVRWYYDVWECLPQVRSGLFGRGAFALSAEGQARVAALPSVMSDDLAMSEAFNERERLVVEEAVVVVRPPRRLADLLRRRVRVVTGNRQIDDLGLRAPTAATSLGTVVRLGLHQPRLLVRLPVFLGVTLTARLLAHRAVRSQDFDTWHRDESSRRSAALPIAPSRSAGDRR